MPQRLILHIGRHKTGTSAIQQYCRNATEQFAQHSTIYPEAGRRRDNGGLLPAHHRLATLCQPRTHDVQILTEMKESFFKEIEGYDTVIVSSEAFQNIRDFSLIEEFFEGFSAFDVTILCYLREYLSYVVSSYRQMVQNQQQFVSFTDYCRRDMKIDDFLENWARYGDFVTRPFQREQLIGGDVVEDFLAQLGMEREGSGGQIFNYSIGGNLLFFRLLENRLNLDPIPYRSAEKLAIEHPPFRSAFYISDESAADIRAKSSYNDIVASRVGELSLPSYADEPIVPDFGTIDQDLERVYWSKQLDQIRQHLETVRDESQTWLEYRGEDIAKGKQVAAKL